VNNITQVETTPPDAATVCGSGEIISAFSNLEAVIATSLQSPPSGELTAQELQALEKQHARRWWVLALVGLSQVMVILDATVVNIALPEAQQTLGFSDASRQWVVTGYALAFGGLLLLGGRLGDIFGRRNVFLIGLLGFGVFSALGGAANGFGVLVTARVGQGIFGALLAPATLALLTVTFRDPIERAKAFGIFGAIAGGGGALGLILGGVLTDQLSWRYCLYVNLVIAVPALIVGLRLLAKDRPTEAPGHDIPGSIAVTGGLFSLVYGFANAESNGWTDTWTMVWIAVGFVLIAAFTLIETRAAHPLLPLRVLADRNRSSSLLSMLFAGAALFGVFLFLTYYLQTGLLYSPTKTGFAFLPMIVGLAISIQIGGQLLTKVGPRPIVPVGMLLAAGGMGLFTQLELNSSYLTAVLPGLFITGLGLGLIFAPSIQTAVSGLTNQDATVGSALVTTMQQIGGSIGIAIFSTLFASTAADYVAENSAGATTPAAQAALAAQATIEGYGTVYVWGGAIFLLGAVMAAVMLRNGTIEGDAETVLVH
jgi:EmrB/QacA subfamily drug resistance transporter